MRRGYADTPFGQIHYVEEGRGEPVLLLHQTPRSWDEYRDVLPLLGEHRRAIAMDTLGFGASARPQQAWSIELFADGVVALCDAIGLPRVSLVGHHTGGVVALDVAARLPERVTALVLSGVPYVDAERRRRVASRPPIDQVDARADGGHLLELWRGRESYYPADRPDLKARLVRDALTVLDRVEEGHEAVNAYRMEERVGQVLAPTLILCGALDTFSRPDMTHLKNRIPGARSALLPETGVPSVDHRPEQFARAVAEFLTECERPTAGAERKGAA
ncbi:MULTISPECIES: alpha/beta fold hydrolase [unclassified Streptomyces]|uniref:alpha/beta fold hydrolase n=1 Tax=unclassified Streptomyces TaxID=2593676 RepID=UPI00278C7B7C|nr:MULTISPECIES: alpha/beta fold hydrolase [unclassified Streptomyces]